jgi:UDP-N-acetylglucosamine 2-epimerase (non-hydrolysing)
MAKAISVVLGTRPEIIKLTPVLYELRERGIRFELVHTGQHYDENMNQVFFQELSLPQPDVQLHSGGLSRSEQIHLIYVELAKHWQAQRPQVVIVQGDTNTVLAAAEAAHDLQIPIAHVEAGLRSFDKTMPEEENRVVTDHLASWLFAPTLLQKHFLAAENITKGVHVVGNTIADMMRLFPSAMGERLDPFILLTLHRPSNVDDPQILSDILINLVPVAQQHQLTIVWPVHPRTRKVLSHLTTLLPADTVKLIAPLGLFDFLQLEKQARVVISDSGGVQEETCILGTACLTLRANTERQETLARGSNHLIKEPAQIAAQLSTTLSDSSDWVSPYGDGHTANRILDVLSAEIG